GCAILSLPAPDPDAAEALMRRALADTGLEGSRAAVRLTLTAGSGGRGLDRPAGPQPAMIATAASAPRPDAPARLITSAIRRNQTSPAARLKTLSYVDNVLARAGARAAGGDEALMLNGRGELACAAAANLFWLDGDRLCTPALDCGVLPGTVRARVLAAAVDVGLRAVELRAGPEALGGAGAVFITNALIGLRPVAAIDRLGFEPWDGLAALAAAAR
ncbi:MAG: 4-amino-4-deoxychorismate lyase, partial [Phenylobacterium sp.]|nr:4-amino-4-deoxychorismate lyase [Phenylobacterium sp.]